MTPFIAYNAFASDLVCNIDADRLAWTDDALVLDGLTVRLTGINSAIASDSTDSDDDDARKLVLGTHQCRLPRTGDPVHIVLAHHPPNWLRDWQTVAPYFRRAHLVLFGHEHRFAARQQVDGCTVEIFAGAVGPERLGKPPEYEYAPAWNWISITRTGGELRVDILPRVWDHDETAFVEHPDGPKTFRVLVELEKCRNREEEPSEVIDLSDESDTVSASPLTPDVEAPAPGLDVVDADQRSRRRKLAVDFMSLPKTQRVEIARRVGVVAAAEVADLYASEAGRELLERIRDADRIEDLARELSP